jgi:small subunit ribosomal protein S3
LRADIDYGFAEALTTYGIIGVKVWLYKGDIMENDPLGHDKNLEAANQGPSQNQGGYNKKR